MMSNFTCVDRARSRPYCRRLGLLAPAQPLGETLRMVTSSDVSWQLDDITMYGTVVRPDGDGPFPAVVLVAGSGPTDRDWCSPLLPGTNGSARLLADAFAEAGIASLRYDKRASGPHARDNVPQLIGRLSMQSHLEEVVGAVHTLVGLDCIDSSRVAGLGNSEGTLHVLHYATTDQSIPFRAVVLAAPPGRPIETVLLAQLAQQATQLPDGAALMAKVEEAASRYSAGQPMDPDPSIPDGVTAVLVSFENPANLPLARELWVESATDLLPQVRVPTLVLIGGKDIQIDQHADGDPLREAAAGMSNVTFAFPPNANHVLKAEPRTPAEIVASGDSGYNDDKARLDPESVTAILEWLSQQIEG